MMIIPNFKIRRKRSGKTDQKLSKTTKNHQSKNHQKFTKIMSFTTAACLTCLGAGPFMAPLANAQNDCLRNRERWHNFGSNDTGVLLPVRIAENIVRSHNILREHRPYSINRLYWDNSLQEIAMSISKNSKACGKTPNSAHHSINYPQRVQNLINNRKLYVNEFNIAPETISLASKSAAERKFHQQIEKQLYAGKPYFELDKGCSDVKLIHKKSQCATYRTSIMPDLTFMACAQACDQHLACVYQNEQVESHVYEEADDFFSNFRYEVACDSCDYCCAPYCIDHLMKSENKIINDIIEDVMVTTQNLVDDDEVDQARTDTVTIVDGKTARSFSSITDVMMHEEDGIQNPDEPFSSSGSGGYDEFEIMTETDDEDLTGTKKPPRAEYLTPSFVPGQEQSTHMKPPKTGKTPDYWHESEDPPKRPSTNNNNQGNTNEGDSNPNNSNRGTVIPPIMQVKGDRGPPGMNGVKGERGLNGLKGVPGTDGRDGRPGAAGEHGKNGNDGPPGSSGNPGRDGVGIPGSKGGKGDRGLPGNVGKTGSNGGQGKQGPPGAPGSKGLQGDEFDIDEFDEGEIRELWDKLEPHHETWDHKIISPAGPPGAAGGMGGQGEPGMTGPTGRQGLSGENGFDGQKGEKGELGKTGSRGDSGYCMAKVGDYNPRVDVNIQKCPAGEPGPPGLAGKNGLSGMNGLDGATGPQGKTGQRGEMGPQGNSGIQGQPGPPGPPGRTITVEASKSGSASTPGQPGLPGNTGPIGPMGPRGASGAPGEPGNDGNDGNPGHPGAMGPQGETGDPGNDGRNGQAGVMGPMGLRGEAGKDGASGPPGLDGGVAARGDKGETGDQGPAGINGIDGLRGERGQSGPHGKNGKNGKPGPPGPAGKDGVSTSSGGSTFSKPGKRGAQGLPGPAGKDGQDGRPGQAGARGTPGTEGKPGTCDQKCNSKAVETVTSGVNQYYNIYSTFSDLNDHFKQAVVGSMGFVLDNSRLFVKTNRGWSQVILGTPIAPPCINCNENPGQKILPPPTPTRPPSPVSNKTWVAPEPIDCRGMPHLVLASLNRPIRGSFRGLKTADKYCFRSARSSAYNDGTYRAFLSSNDQDLRNVVTRSSQNLPICNVQGKMLFRSWTELVNNHGKYHSDAEILSFRGKPLSQFNTNKIWHGSTNRGIRESAGYCDSWRQSNDYNFGRVSYLDDHQLLKERSLRCDNTGILLCIRIKWSTRRGKREIEAPYSEQFQRRSVDRYLDDLENI